MSNHTALNLTHLNKKQFEAVNQIEGPVMVIAGPGTGKTQILAARIANILASTDSNAENVLCLTFTDAGATAMRNRLTKFIGAEAYKIHIHTFHSFCNYVIQHNKDLFDYIDWQPVSDLEKHEIMRAIINDLPIDHPLKRAKGQLYYDINPLLGFFDLMKKESISPAHINQLVADLLAGLPFDENYIYKRNGKDFKKGDVKHKDIAIMEKKMAKITSAAMLFDTYNSKLKENNRYDFNDMISWVVTLFENKEEVLLKYQEQFLYFLVDEFQDTNTTQYHILKLLTNYWDAPNLFVVGDDDQTIYRFQGADMDNILQFEQRYHDYVKVVVLEQNYRSTQPILNLASTLISNNQRRLARLSKAFEKKLTATKEFKQIQNPVIKKFNNAYAETIHLAQEIESKIAQGIAPNDIAIIYKKHKHADQLLAYFNNKAIPYQLVKKVNVFDIDIIAELITLLKYISDECKSPFSGASHLFKLLHFEVFNLPVLQLASLTQKATFEKVSFREIVHQMNQQEPDNPALVQLNDVLRLLDKCIRLGINKTPANVLEFILNEMGMFKYIYEQKNRKIQLEALTTFFNFLKEESERKLNLTLEQFLQTLDEMQTYNIPLAMNYIYSDKNGVNLMTAHGSKGLEFKYVYVINCSLNEWDKENTRYMYDLKELFPQLKDDGLIEDNRRLFYVAMTRAEEELTLSYHIADTKGKDLAPSQYIAELITDEHVTLKEVEVNEQDTSDFIVSYAPPTHAPKIPLIDKSIIEAALKNYTLSVTHLNTYLRCPISFYFKHILRIPAAKNANMAFGSAVHGTLEKVFIEAVNQNQTPNSQQMLKWFEYQLVKQKANFTSEDFNRLLAYGGEILPAYLDARIGDWTAPSYETEIRINTTYKNTPINGMLDNVALYGSEVVVTDYKTGKAEKSKHKLNEPGKGSASHAFELKHGGDYWRQIMFYKILIDNDIQHNWNMTRGLIDYIEPNDKGDFIKEQIPVSLAGVDLVKEQITTTYEQIMAQNFENGCGEEDCEWCNFSRSYYQKSH